MFLFPNHPSAESFSLRSMHFQKRGSCFDQLLDREFKSVHELVETLVGTYEGVNKSLWHEYNKAMNSAGAGGAGVGAQRAVQGAQMAQKAGLTPQQAMQGMRMAQ